MSATRILVPLDGSAVAAHALPYAEILAAVRGSTIELLSVVEPEPRGVTMRSERTAAEIERRESTVRARYLDEYAKQLRARELRTMTTVAVGDRVDVILAAAEQPETWAVVMATRGAGGVGRWLIGSVADKVMRLNPKPTLLVRPPAIAGPPRRVALRRIIVPLDGSALAEAALPVARDLAASAGAELLLVRVVPWFIEGWPLERADASIRDTKAELTADAESYLEKVRGQFPPDAAIETLVAYGDPAETLVDLAMYERADLTVMTTHGHGGVRRLVLGSTADRVVRAGVPALLIRPPAAPDDAASRAVEAAPSDGAGAGGPG